MAATVIVLLLQTSQDSGEGHWCPPNCVWMDQRCVCAVPDKDNEEPPISPPIPAVVILLFCKCQRFHDMVTVKSQK